MEERVDIKKAEMAYLAKRYAEHPELFLQPSFVEDAQTLGEFGIYIPGKESCHKGLLKLWPEDFIVEEQTGIGGSSVSGNNTLADSDGQTVYATLVKCGVSTIEAVEDQARKLNLRIEDIAYAGIKDKDAFTAQSLSFRRTTVEAVTAVASAHFLLKDIRRGQGVVEKGSLKGNRFTILVRTGNDFGGEESVELFRRKLEALGEFGFYNFFYLQRFGTPRLNNFAWARLILMGKYEEAVKDILAFEGSREMPYFKQIRRQMGQKFGQWQEIQKMIEPLPLMFRHEHRLVSHLAAHPGDYVGALQTIPEQITLWMYALSSILFNQYISNCLIEGSEPPERLPFFLSRDAVASAPYKDMLENLKIYPPQFNNLRPFPQILLKTREAPTKDKVAIRKAEVVDEGIVFEFELAKGQYATTFLAHLFNLVGGPVSPEFAKSRVDVKKVLGEEPLQPLLEYFADVIHAKDENTFEILAGEA